MCTMLRRFDFTGSAPKKRDRDEVATTSGTHVDASSSPKGTNTNEGPGYVEAAASVEAAARQSA